MSYKFYSFLQVTLRTKCFSGFDCLVSGLVKNNSSKQILLYKDTYIDTNLLGRQMAEAELHSWAQNSFHLLHTYVHTINTFLACLLGKCSMSQYLNLPV